MIKILHINTTFGRAGAALSVEQLSEALNKTGEFRSDILVGYLFDEKYSGRVTRLGSRAEYYINAAIDRLSGWSAAWYPIDRFNKIAKIVSNYDIVHLHNLHGYYFKLKYLDALKDKKIVWTIRDYWPLTGRCCFPLDCGGWEHGCGRCPHLDYYPATLAIDLSGHNYRLRREALNRLDDLHLVAISKSTENMIKRAQIKYRSLEVIYNGLNSSDYYRQTDTDLLGQAKTGAKKKLLVMAAKMEKRKGRGILEEVFKLMPGSMKSKYHIILAGDMGQLLGDGCLEGFSCSCLGYLKDLGSIRSAYSSADLFINPTLSETFGRTTVESMLCGTPVVGLKNEIMEEILQDGDMLVQPGENAAKAMLAKIEEYFARFAAQEKYSAGNVRQRALRFSVDNMLNKYKLLYENIMGKNV